MFGARRVQDPYSSTAAGSGHNDQALHALDPVPAVAVPASPCVVEVQPIDIVAERDGPPRIDILQHGHHLDGQSNVTAQSMDRNVNSVDQQPVQLSENRQNYVAVANAVPTAWSALQPNTLPTPVAREEGQDQYERERILLNLYQRSRLIRVVSILDMCFIIVFGLFSFWFFLLLPFPFCGYFGARRWSYRLLFMYALYLVLELIGGIVSIIFLRATTFIFVRIIYMILNLIVARYTINIASYILVMDDQDLYFLKHSPIIENIERSMIC